jgi:hypothetical protein
MQIKEKTDIIISGIKRMKRGFLITVILLVISIGAN